MLASRTIRLAAACVVAAAAAAVAAAALAGAVTSSGPNPPTPRVARLERQVTTLQRQLANVQAVALGTAQQVQAGHDAFDRVTSQVDYLTERVAWLEARVDRLEGK